MDFVEVYYSFFKSYLENRRICIMSNGTKSDFFNVSHGVPQGLVLGPILFLLYENDLPNVSKFETTLFADDTNLHQSNTSFQQLQIEVSKEINKVDEGMTKNRLTLNYSKSNYMILSKNDSKTAHFKLQIKQNIIPLTSSVKYLNKAILNNTLSWQTHIDKITIRYQECVEWLFNLGTMSHDPL